MSVHKGFVLIELIVVLALFGALLGMTSINLLGAKNTATLSATVDGVVSDLGSQQTKAMTSTTAGAGAAPYGVRFESNRYILFRGAQYNASDLSNSSVGLDARTTFSVINVPNASVVFASRSGEIIGFNPSQASVTVYQQNSLASKTIHINQYGIVTSVQ
jgi:prepilin-type N-terminal cleavage/methylation domain-containing protein